MRTWLKSATARSGAAVGHHEPSPPCGERVGRGGVDSEPDVLARPQLASDLTARTPNPNPPRKGEGLILTGWLGLAAVVSWAVAVESTPGNDRNLGVEIDPDLTYRAGAFRISLEHALFLPGPAFDNPAADLAAQPAQLLRLRLALHY